jgi:ATP-dependent Clp protease ATP-binding subunit ClpA
MSEQTAPQMLGSEPMSLSLEKFSAQAKTALDLAQEEARYFRHGYIGTEHLLLGILRTNESQAVAALADLGIDLEMARQAVERNIGFGNLSVEGKLGLTPRMMSALSLAVREAERLKQSPVGPEHLLLGMLREGEGVAVGILTKFGADTARVRAQILRSIELPAVTAEAASTRNTVIACRVEKRDLDAIDALIETGIRSTRSDAAAWLIHAGIQANKDLFEKVNGTVAEIRRLREAVQQYVQEDKQEQARPDP